MILLQMNMLNEVFLTIFGIAFYVISGFFLLNLIKNRTQNLSNFHEFLCGLCIIFYLPLIKVIFDEKQNPKKIQKQKKDNSHKWIKFESENVETYPKKYGKYFVCRKDGKVHWETWNGSGWAYNGNTICYYALISSPPTIKTKF